MENQRQHKVVKAYYQVYEKTNEGWFLCKLGHEVPNHAWLYNLTPSKIVTEFFRLQQGMAGYYCVNLRLKKYYYCGFTLLSVWQKLSEIKGFCHNDVVWIGSTSGSSKKEILEKEPINLGPSDKMLVFEFDGRSFRPLDLKSITSQSDVDFGIIWEELKRKFFELNGGQAGFYLYGTKDDEAKYFATATLLREAFPLTQNPS